MKTMVLRDPTKPVSVIHHETKTYKPTKKGIFEVDDAHVDALRSHGLMLEGEKAELADAKNVIADKDATIKEQGEQIADLTARLEKLEKKG
jgi:hypothetical protein